MNIKEEHKLFVKGSFWQLVSSFSLKLVSLVYMIIITRLFSQSEIGEFYFAFSIVSIIAIFNDLGLGISLFRYIPYFEGKKYFSSIHKIIRLTVVIGLSLSTLLAFILYFFAEDITTALGNPEAQGVLRILSLSIIANEIFSIVRSILLGRKLVKMNFLSDNIQNLSKIVFTVAFVFFFGSDSVILSAALVLSTLIGISIGFFPAVKTINNIPKTSKEKNSYTNLLKDIAPFGFTLSLILVFNNLLSYSDRLLISYFGNPATLNTAIAVYSVTVALASTLTIFANSFRVVFMPIVSEIYGKNETKKANVAEMTDISTKWTLLFSFPLFVSFLVFPVEMLKIIYGQEYMTGANVLVIYTIGLAFFLFGFMQRIAISTMRQLKTQLILVGSSGVLNILLNALLIPIYSIEGAAVSSMLSFMFLTFFTQHYSKKLFGYYLSFKSVSKYIFGALPAILLLIILKFIFIDPLILSTNYFSSVGDSIISSLLDKLLKIFIIVLFSALTTLFYFILLFRLKVFNNTDIKLFSEFLRKLRIFSEKSVIDIENYFVNKLITSD